MAEAAKTSGPQQAIRTEIHSYSGKPSGYFAGVRTDYVSQLPKNPQAKILEIGCSNGGTGFLALQEGKCGTYCGVELMPDAAHQAKDRITEVLVGNIETMTLPWPPEHFDALIISEVLEHLVDPWAALRKLHPLLKHGASVFASSPNVSHHKIIRMLLRGEWNLTDMGVMDRTHLRWFTPAAYKALFESSGYVVDSVGQVGTLSRRARTISFLTWNRFRHCFMEQISLQAHRP